MARNVLLAGRYPVLVEDAERQVTVPPSVRFFAATGLGEVRDAFAEAEIDHVIMGAGLDIEVRLEIVREVFRMSDTTTVHLKDFASGLDGFLPFAQAVLDGLTAHDS